MQHGKFFFAGDNACQYGVHKVCDADNSDDDTQRSADGDDKGSEVVKGASIGRLRFKIHAWLHTVDIAVQKLCHFCFRSIFHIKGETDQMGVITQRQEDFCREIEPSFACVAGGGRVLVGPDFCHDDKVIAISNGGGKFLCFQMVDPYCITHADIGVLYDRSIIVTLHAQQDILS